MEASFVLPLKQPLATLPNVLLDVERQLREMADDQEGNFAVLTSRWHDGKLILIAEVR